MTDRPTPFELIFAGLAAERFPALREALDDAPAIDAFLMAAPVVELLHHLRPEEGLGAGVDDFVALVHAAYRHWADDAPVRRLDAETTRALLAPGRAMADEARRPVEYIQVAPRLIWARLEGAEAHEPLDGWFTVPTVGGLRVIACLGVHPARPGVSVLTAEGVAPDVVPRDDASPPFAPTMTGGDLAGLASIVNPAELLALGWRALDD